MKVEGRFCWPDGATSVEVQFFPVGWVERRRFVREWAVYVGWDGESGERFAVYPVRRIGLEGAYAKA